MTDAFDRLRNGISDKLPTKADKELLEELVDLHRKGGIDMLEKRIKELIDEVGGEL